jgi:hypothetical protein
VNILYYFQRPFPSRQGFSAYRFPGVAAHIPFLIALTAAGVFLCGQYAALKPLLLVWIVAGLFLGRDIAILCHYAPFLLLLIWAAMYAVIAESHRLVSLGRQHPTVGVLLTALLLVIQVGIAWRSTRTDT